MCVWPEEVSFGTSYKVTIRPKIGVWFWGSGGGEKLVYPHLEIAVLFFDYSAMKWLTIKSSYTPLLSAKQENNSLGSGGSKKFYISNSKYILIPPLYFLFQLLVRKQENNWQSTQITWRVSPRVKRQKWWKLQRRDCGI